MAVWEIALIFKKRTLASFFAVFVVGFAVLIHLTDSFKELLEERFKNNAEDELLAELLLAKSNLESDLFKDVFLVDSLATIFNIDPRSAADNFPKIARRLLEKSEHVRNVGMAPNDVISQLVPLPGNESAIGFDFRTVPEQYATVQAARERQDIFLAGPVNLVQGGRGLIARIPVFNDYPSNEDYWGTVSVVIDYDDLMLDSGLLAIPSTDVALRGINGSGLSGAIFEGPAELFEESDYNGKLIVPNGEWWVAANFVPILTPTQVWFLQGVRIGMLLLYVLLFAMVVLLWAFYRREKYRANEDVLTRLVNRRFALGYLNRRLTNTKSRDRFCVIAVDLNYFKEINDNFGHDSGDHVLRAVAHRLEAAVRSSDIVARMGGDEFLVIVNRLKDMSHIEKIIEKIRSTVEGEDVLIDELSIRPSISIGSACSSEGGLSVAKLLKLADTRMYEDKKHIKSLQQSPFEALTS
ncbi:diguanylate cyclase [Pseudidiomarina sp.]|uniref:diguanylate cyclase n=1 Tax=Pseudidiomarina sp. TaxID=2081707 RepID=UPI003A97917D